MTLDITFPDHSFRPHKVPTSLSSSKICVQSLLHFLVVIYKVCHIESSQGWCMTILKEDENFKGFDLHADDSDQDPLLMFID